MEQSNRYRSCRFHVLVLHQSTIRDHEYSTWYQFSTHAIDFGRTEEFYGIPFIVTTSNTTGKNAIITYGVDGENYSSESDQGPAAIPLNAPIEGGSSSAPNPTSGDRHLISIDVTECVLFETYATVRTGNGFRCG